MTFSKRRFSASPTEARSRVAKGTTCCNWWETMVSRFTTNSIAWPRCPASTGFYGSAGSDVIWLRADQLADTHLIDGGFGQNALRLAGADVNLVGKTIHNFTEVVVLDDNAVITVDNSQTAKLVRGNTVDNRNLLTTARSPRQSAMRCMQTVSISSSPKRPPMDRLSRQVIYLRGSSHSMVTTSS